MAVLILYIITIPSCDGTLFLVGKDRITWNQIKAEMIELWQITVGFKREGALMP